MSYELTGNIYKIGDTVEVSPTFSKREICITIPGDYQQIISLELHKDKCILADSFQVGQEVTVSFFLNGRAWVKPETGIERVFNTLSAYKIEAIAQDKLPSTEQPPSFQQPATPSLTPPPDDSIPF